MRDPQIIALQGEAALLYRACTGGACPEDIQAHYAGWVFRERGGKPMRIPPVLRACPFLMAACEPLPGRNPEFDARRSAIVTLAEHHHSAPLFYRYHAEPWPKLLASLALIAAKEILILPMRMTLARFLW